MCNFTLRMINFFSKKVSLIVKQFFFNIIPRFRFVKFCFKHNNIYKIFLKIQLAYNEFVDTCSCEMMAVFVAYSSFT